MAATRSGRKLPSIRTLWAIAKSPELRLSDEDLHGVVYRETGKERHNDPYTRKIVAYSIKNKR